MSGSPLPALREANTAPSKRAYRVIAHLAEALIPRVGRVDYRNREKVPRTGGVLFVANHISHFDPIVIGHYLIFSGRWPRYLGKVQIWGWPVIGWLARNLEQIPVERGSDKAKNALVAAQASLADGQAVVLYPEGTLTRDPRGWPMAARSGAARLALETGAPVVPIGQWGAQAFWPAGAGRPRLTARPTFTVVCGDPVPLDDLRALPLSPDVVREATDRILSHITHLVEIARGETAPIDRWDDRNRPRPT